MKKAVNMKERGTQKKGLFTVLQEFMPTKEFRLVLREFIAWRKLSLAQRNLKQQSPAGLLPKEIFHLQRRNW